MPNAQNTEPIPDTYAATSWRQADDSVHVAHRDGQYAGFVEQTRAGWRAHGATGAALGVHATSAQARAAVESDAPRLPRTPSRIDATAAKTLAGAGTAHATTRAPHTDVAPALQTVAAAAAVPAPAVRRTASPRTRAQRRSPRSASAAPSSAAPGDRRFLRIR